MKKIIFTLLALTGAMTAQAYDYPYLTFMTGSGTLTSLSVSSLTITVSDGQLVVTNSGGSQTFTLSDLSKMYFSTEDVSTGISSPAVTDEVEVLTVDGISLGRFAGVEQARTALKSGTYVIKSKSKTFKMTVR